jgi:hypothetical protein
MSTDQSFLERTLSIDSSDVVKLMLQYCKENHLLSTMQQMQKETGISLNTVDNIDHFINDIKQGKWDSVLNQLSMIKLPIGKLVSSISLFLVSFLSAVLVISFLAVRTSFYLLCISYRFS